MGEPALKIEQPAVQEVKAEVQAGAKKLELPVESMSDFMERMNQGAQVEVGNSTEQAEKIAKGDPVAQAEIKRSQEEAERALAHEKAKLDKKLEDVLGPNWKAAELEKLSNVKLPANDNDREALKQSIEDKKNKLNKLTVGDSSKESKEESKDEAAQEFEKKQAEVLRLEIQLLEQTKERDAVQRSIQKTEQDMDRLNQQLERVRKKEVPDPLEEASIEASIGIHSDQLEQGNIKLLELGGKMVALDGLLGRTKHELKVSGEKVEQNKVASAREKLRQIESTKKAQEQTRRQEKKSKVSGWSVAGGATGALFFGGFTGIAKIADWVDRGLDYLTKNDLADKLANIVKLPFALINRGLDWAGKKVGLEPDKKNPEKNN